MTLSPKAARWVRHTVDYGGLVAFIATLAVTRSLVVATWGLVVGAALSLIVGLVFERRLAPMPLVSGGAALLFGGLTLFLHDERFIKIKPTIIYLGFAAFLFTGLLRGKNPLKALMGEAFHLPDPVIRTLTWRYALFFLSLAAANELVWRTQSTMTWALFKFPGVLILTFAFSMAQVPLMMKHSVDPPPTPPPE